jgi:hypothetical protein
MEPSMVSISDATGEKPDESQASSVQGMSRKEFLTTVVKGAAVAGVIVAAPKVVDKFLVPPVYAANSTTAGPPTHDVGHG